MATLEGLEEKLNTLDSILSRKESLLREKDETILVLAEENQRLKGLHGAGAYNRAAVHRNYSDENRLILAELFGTNSVK